MLYGFEKQPTASFGYFKRFCALSFLIVFIFAPTLSLAQVNQAPVLTVPGTQSGTEDTNKVITGSSLSDADAGASSLEVTLTGHHGTITLDTTSGLTFSTGDGSSDEVLVFTGDPTSINEAIDNLTFSPNLNANSENTGYLKSDFVGKTGDGVYSYLNYSWKSFVSGNYLYQSSSSSNAVHIIDISDPTQPVVQSVMRHNVNGIQYLNAPRGIYVSGNYLYVASYSSDSVNIIDISDPLNPNTVSTIRDGVNGFTRLNGAVDVFVSGNLLFITALADDALTIVDVTNPASPVLRSEVYDGDGEFSNLNGAHNVKVSGNYAFVTAQTDQTLTIMDISDETDPDLVAEVKNGVNGFSNLANMKDVLVSGSYAYVTACNSNSLTIVDISTPSSPSQAAQLRHNNNGYTYLACALGLAMTDDGHLAVTAANSDALTLIDVNDPTNPSLVYQGNNFSDLDGPQFPFISGDYLYVGTQTSGSYNVINWKNALSPGIVLSANDQGNTGTGGAQTDTETIPITISSQNDASPVVALNSSAIAYTEGVDGNTVYQFLDTNASISDLDGGNLDGGTLTVSWSANGSSTDQLNINANSFFALSVSGNTVRWSINNTATTIGTYTGGTNGTDLVITFNSFATITMAQALLRSIQYHTTSDTPVASKTVQIVLTDGDGGTSNSATRVISITSINDSPIVNSPGVQTIAEDDPLTLSGLSVSDPDAGADPVQITINGSNGTVSLNGTTGLTFSTGDGSADSSMAFTGAITDINTALDDLIFTPNPDVNDNTAVGNGLIQSLSTRYDGNSGFTNLRYVRDVAVSGNYAYIVGNEGFQILDISSKSTPVLKGILQQSVNGVSNFGTPQGIAVSGNYAYVVCSGSNSFNIIDISDKDNPVFTAQILDGNNGFTKLGNASRVAVSGNYAYVTAENSLTIVNVSDKNSPTMVDQLTDGSNHGSGSYQFNTIWGVRVDGNYLYVSACGDDSFTIIDITDPENEAFVGMYQSNINLDCPRDFSVSGNYVYTSGGNDNDFTILDISDKSNPLLETKVTNGSGPNSMQTPRVVSVANNYAYVFSFTGDSIAVFDITDPTNPIFKTEYTDNNDFSRLDGPIASVIDGNYLYWVSNTDHGFSITSINSAGLLVSIDDQGNNGTGGAKVTHSTVPISISAVDIPSKPSITSPGSGIFNISINPSLTSSAYVANGATHTNSDWKITTDAAGSNIVWSTDNDTINKTNITVNASNGTFSGTLNGETGLTSNTQYYAFVRYENSEGHSDWSNANSFTTVYAGSTVTQSWDFSTASDYDFDSNYIEVDAGSNDLAQLIDLGGASYQPTGGADGNTKRKAITITNNVGSVLTNFQVRLNVTYDADMQADFDDLRFTTSDASTKIDYFVESKTNSSSAVVWVEVPNLAASTNTTIYMYYGNLALSSESDGSSVFPFFDDFENYTGWSTIGSGTIAQSSSFAYNGTYALAKTNNGDPNGGSKSLGMTVDRNNWILESFLYRPSNALSGVAERLGLEDSSQNGYSFNYWHNTGLRIDERNSGSPTANCSGNLNNIQDQWYIGRLIFTTTDVIAEQLNTNYALQTTCTYSNTDHTSFTEFKVRGGNDYYVDVARVRKYASTDPTVSIGPETGSGGSYNLVQIAPSFAGDHPPGNPRTFAVTLGAGHQGEVQYQIGLDTDYNGSPNSWYWHNGSTWIPVLSDGTNNNTAAEINSYLPSFNSTLGNGDIYFKAFLISNGTQKVEIDRIDLTYTPAVINFSAISQSVNEGAGTVTVRAQTNLQSGKNIVVPFTLSGTASGSGVDHNLSNGAITISAGQTSGSTNFTITNDNLDEADETVILTMGTPSIGVQGGITIHTVTLIDNDTTPITSDSTLHVMEDTAVTATLSGSDSDGSPLTYSILSSTSQGTATLLNASTGTFRYTPNLNISGLDSFTFKAEDGTQTSNISTVNIIISAVDDRPTTNGQSIEAHAGQSTPVQLIASDIDSSSLQYSIVTQPKKGTISSLSKSKGTLNYTANETSEGTDSFTFKVNDGSSDSNIATVQFNIVGTSTGSPPTVNIPKGNFQVKTGTRVRLRSVANDPDGDSLSYAWSVTQGQPISLSNADRDTISFTSPARGANGFSVIQVSVSDGKNPAVTKHVRMTIVKDQIDTSKASKIESFIVAANDGEIITESEDTDDQITGKFLKIGDREILSSSQTSLVVKYYDRNTVFIGYPSYDNNRGMVAKLDLSNPALAQSIDLDDPDLLPINGLDFAEGSQDNNLFGYQIEFSDWNQDEITDLIITSPGTSNGMISVLRGDTMELLSVLIGSDVEQLKTTLLASANIDGQAGEDIITGVGAQNSDVPNLIQASESASLDESLIANSNVVASTSEFNGLFVKGSMDSVIDFAEQEADFNMSAQENISHISTGNINGDFYTDIVMASQQACNIKIVYGGDELGQNLIDLSQANTIQCIESETFGSLAVSDVSGDGIDDIIVGFPEAGEGSGRIYVILGRLDWDESEYDMSQGILIEGSGDQKIGNWMLLADEDGDGILDIYTNDGENEKSLIINVKSLALTNIDNNDVETENIATGNGAGPGGLFCSLNTKKHSSSEPLKLLFVLGMGFLLLVRRLKKSTSSLPSKINMTDTPL